MNRSKTAATLAFVFGIMAVLVSARVALLNKVMPYLLNILG